MDAGLPRVRESADPANGERVLHGMGVSQGIAIGPVYLYTREALDVQRRPLEPDEVEQEIERFRAAVANAERELEKIASVAREKLGETSAGIFMAQALMLQDVAFQDEVIGRIRNEHINAGYVVKAAISESRQRMEASESEYIRERANDLLDVQDRIVRNLRRGKLISAIEPETIVIAENLTAADVILFSRRNIRGCATDFGGPTSHVSIMARALGVPAVVSMHRVSRDVEQGDMVILDGFNGRVIVNPTPKTRQVYERLRERYQRLVKEQRAYIPLASETRDGVRISLRANLEFKEEIELVDEFGAEGIGLFRTEFLFLMRGKLTCTEDEQYETYRDIVLSNLNGPTTLRLLDLGGDKMLPMAHREHNPFLGWRGIRVLLDKQEDLLIPQLRAILRASAHGPVRILVPMITDVAEVIEVKQIMAAVKEDLRHERVPFDEETPFGIMVEVPAVALTADHFASEVDFFSIGTNDLTQYVLAVDRGNDLVSDLYQALHPSVLLLIERIVAAADKEGIPVSVCGELAADPRAIPILVGLGIREFSAAPIFLPEIKRVIRSMERHEAEQLAREVMHTYDQKTRSHILLNWLKARDIDYFQFLRDETNGGSEPRVSPQDASHS
ncbi:MAG: phosphoenolpyruvate--protein phosphotransferase [Rhodothermales bacterium]